MLFGFFVSIGIRISLFLRGGGCLRGSLGLWLVAPVSIPPGTMVPGPVAPALPLVLAPLLSPFTLGGR
jgi:hypothetical protein